MEVCEFEASLLYIVSSRMARVTQKNPVSKTKQTKIQTLKYFHEALQIMNTKPVYTTIETSSNQNEQYLYLRKYSTSFLSQQCHFLQ